MSKTAVCILLKTCYDCGQEIREKWTDSSKAQDAVNQSSPLSHLLWYFSYLPDKWTAWLSGGVMLDVSGRAREKTQLKLETSEGKEVSGW